VGRFLLALFEALQQLSRFDPHQPPSVNTATATNATALNTSPLAGSSSYTSGLSGLLQQLVQELNAQGPNSSIQTSPTTAAATVTSAAATTPATTATTSPTATTGSTASTASGTSATSATSSTSGSSTSSSSGTDGSWQSRHLDRALHRLERAFSQLVSDLGGGSASGSSASTGSASTGSASAPSLVSFLQTWLTNLQSDLGGTNSTSGTLVNTSA
jgi:hypothetical protein